MIRINIAILAVIFLEASFISCGNKSEGTITESDSVLIVSSKYKILDCANIIQDNASTCGVSAALTVLEYYGIDEYADKLAKRMNTSYETGTEMEEIANVMKTYGLNINMGQMTIEDIKHSIDNKAPVIIMLQAYNTSGKYKDENTMKSAEWGHYVTAIGYGDGKIIFADPGSYVKTFLSEEELDLRWKGIDEYKGRKPQLLDKYGISVINRAPENLNKRNIMRHMP